MLKRAVWLGALVVLLSGCSSIRELLGVPAPPEASVTLRAEPRWLLVKNPRFGDVPSEPEYIWVEEDRVPTTLTTLIRGQRALIAPPDIVAKYGPPPGGGKISPRQGLPVPPATAPGRVATGAAASASAGAAVPENSRRGFVIYVDTTRIVIDLTSADGIQPGSLVSLRRMRIPVVHPITGEVLGELDEEVGIARVTETRERFSVAEIQTVASGFAVQVRDRVVPK